MTLKIEAFLLSQAKANHMNTNTHKLRNTIRKQLNFIQPNIIHYNIHVYILLKQNSSADMKFHITS